VATQPEFSIVVCTRNRAELLDNALGALLQIDYPPERVELIVIDNGSSDGTRDVAARRAERSRFAFRYVHEPRVGISVARNRGIAEARGRYVLYSDDDQKVDPAILREYAGVLGEHRVDAVQGAIELEFSAPRPRWLHGELAAFLGETQRLTAGRFGGDLQTGNLLLRRELFQHIEGFREDLGKGAGGYSEDTELSQRLHASGFAVHAAPGARQWHVIGPDRTTPRFLRRTAFEKGLSHAAMGEPRLLLESRRAAASSIRNLVAAARARLRSDDHVRLLSEVRALYALGRLLGYARFIRRAPRTTSPARASAT
jgi:glucosyl-dolichyl phosphate glucuronosyltransferase